METDSIRKSAVKILRLWRRQKQIQVVQRENTNLTLDEFRTDPNLVNTARKLWSHPDFRLLIDVMENSHPAFSVLPPNSHPEVRAAHQAKCEGYTMALANLEAMAVEVNRTTIEPTFDPSN